MKISLIAMDMDGTLLDQDLSRIPRENAEALREAAAAGIHIAICSGRVPDDISLYALDAELPMMHVIALNGSCMLKSPLGDIVYSMKIPDSSMNRLLPILDESGLQYGLFSDNLLSASGAPADPEHPEALWGSNITRPESRAVLAHFRLNHSRALASGVNKVVVLDRDMQHDLPSLAGRLKKEFPELVISSSWPDNLEINARGIDKGWGVTRLAAQLGIPMDEVMTIGDHDNDLSMLKVCGCSVVMGNGSASAFEAANYITLSNTQHGVAIAIRVLALGEKLSGVRKLERI